MKGCGNVPVLFVVVIAKQSLITLMRDRKKGQTEKQNLKRKEIQSRPIEYADEKSIKMLSCLTCNKPKYEQLGLY